MLAVTSLLVAASLAADPLPAPPAAAAAAAAPAPGTPAPPAWTGSAGLGFINTTGNSRTLTLTATGVADRKSEWWIFGARAFGTYGQARHVGQDDTETTALAAGLQLRGTAASRRRCPCTSSGPPTWTT